MISVLDYKQWYTFHCTFSENFKFGQITTPDLRTKPVKSFIRPNLRISDPMHPHSLPTCSTSSCSWSLEEAFCRPCVRYCCTCSANCCSSRSAVPKSAESSCVRGGRRWEIQGQSQNQGQSVSETGIDSTAGSERCSEQYSKGERMYRGSIYINRINRSKVLKYILNIFSSSLTTRPTRVQGQVDSLSKEYSASR